MRFAEVPANGGAEGEREVGARIGAAEAGVQSARLCR
jgi:hypothetical protein